MITVVISSYHYGHLAAHCIETVLGQSVQPEKILFVDDAAGDCKHLPERYPEVDFILRDKNYGTVNNFQDILLNHIPTKYCMFLGADNWIRSDTIELLTKIAELNDPDIITYDMMLTGQMKEKRIPYHKEEFSRMEGDYRWNRKMKHHGSMLYRTELAKSVGGYSKHPVNGAHTAEDWSLWDKMIAAHAKVDYIEQTLLYYRHHRDNFNKY